MSFFSLFDVCVKQCCPTISGNLFCWVVLTNVSAAAFCFNFLLLIRTIFMLSTASWGGGRWRGKCWALLLGSSDRIHWNSLKLHQGRFILYIRKPSFTKMVVKHWKKLPRKVVDAPRLSMFRRHLENALNIRRSGRGTTRVL